MPTQLETPTMTSLHAAASTPRAREMVDTVLAEFDRWLDAKHPTGRPTDPQRDAAYSALLDMREELADHLVIPVGVTLASWEATDG